MSGIIDVAIIGSLFDDGDVKPLVCDYGMVIIDECHHVSAVRFEIVLREVMAKYVYGLSATPTRQDGHHPIIFQQCGPIRYKADAKAQAVERGLTCTVIPRFTQFRKPYTASDNWHITEVYAAITENHSRNQLILNDVSAAISNGRTPLLLTERVNHGKHLAEELIRQHPDTQVLFLSGEGRAKEKRLLLESLREVPKDKPLAIVATGKYVGEGFDEPRLDTLFLTMPFAWKGTLSQYAGRLHRSYESKQDVIIYDYVDMHMPVLERMYHKRLSGYASLGYTAHVLLTETDRNVGTIFSRNNFFETFASDMEHANKEVLIVSPYLGKSQVVRMKRLFLVAIMHGAKVAVITRAPKSFTESAGEKAAELIETLENSGMKIICKETVHQRLAVIDCKTVWYGSINLLAYGKCEESIMRFENAEIAEALLSDLGNELIV